VNFTNCFRHEMREQCKSSFEGVRQCRTLHHFQQAGEQASGWGRIAACHTSLGSFHDCDTDSPCCSRCYLSPQLPMADSSTVLGAPNQATLRRFEGSAHCWSLAASDRTLACPPLQAPVPPTCPSQLTTATAGCNSCSASSSRWAAHVQPGDSNRCSQPLTVFSPVSPTTLRRSLSNSKRGINGNHGWLSCRISVVSTNQQAFLGPVPFPSRICVKFCQPVTNCVTSFVASFWTPFRTPSRNFSTRIKRALR
jgi:hypothetical protein